MEEGEMKEAILHIVDDHPDDIHIDGQTPVPLDAFVLLTKTRGKDFGHMLIFGNADTMGRMIVNLYRWSIRQDPDAAHTLGQAAADILEIERAMRGKPLVAITGGPETVM
jgi:hypothetical protein